MLLYECVSPNDVFRDILMAYMISSCKPISPQKSLDVLAKVYFQRQVVGQTNHFCSLQRFSQDYNLVSHTIYAVCVHVIHVQFKIDSERQIFEKLFHGNFILSQSFFQISAERQLPKKYSFLYFVLLEIYDRGLNRRPTEYGDTNQAI